MLVHHRLHLPIPGTLRHQRQGHAGDPHRTDERASVSELRTDDDPDQLRVHGVPGLS